jgi:hypothetical protein|eukprot:COSAG06_NODE_1435_length_9470_cov_31.749653_6_plen_70_part_00
MVLCSNNILFNFTILCVYCLSVMLMLLISNLVGSESDGKRTGRGRCHQLLTTIKLRRQQQRCAQVRAAT